MSDDDSDNVVDLVAAARGEKTVLDAHIPKHVTERVRRTADEALFNPPAQEDTLWEDGSWALSASSAF